MLAYKMKYLNPNRNFHAQNELNTSISSEKIISKTLFFFKVELLNHVNVKKNKKLEK